ncbi:TIGR02300 family protein [Paracoccus suum]|uniref:TIGR02300 family protein n=1 Tax=Paracoccus suum TaxID=2259340 RepID=A0A344PGA0_9RHOB|nr:TIGR02300 family protein [Paracoccus suum]AXC48405.1 TIGR02300 family protein [Paracoccus suum]
MPKEEWGTKRMCPHCGSRFYDLQADPMTCPVCSETFTAESLVAGRGRAIVREKAAAVDTSDDDDVIETDSELDANEAEADLDDDLLEDDDDGDVSLDEIADVPADEDEN